MNSNLKKFIKTLKWRKKPQPKPSKHSIRQPNNTTKQTILINKLVLKINHMNELLEDLSTGSLETAEDLRVIKNERIARIVDSMFKITTEGPWIKCVLWIDPAMIERAHLNDDDTTIDDLIAETVTNKTRNIMMNAIRSEFLIPQKG